MTVSNIIGPLLVYLDRFAIAALLSIAVVAYYTTPFEVVTKLLILPGAMASVLFPAFAASYVSSSDRTARIFASAVKSLFLLLFPITLFIVAFGRDGLSLWLGPEFAMRSTVVIRLLAAGVLANSLAQVAFSLVQSAGRSDLTAKLHIIELIVYAPAAWYLIRHLGINGAALAWTIRVTVDMLALFVIALRLLPRAERVSRTATLTFALAAAALALGALPAAQVMRVIYVVLCLNVLGFGGWFLILSHEERSLIRAELRERLMRGRSQPSAG